ncbi:MAG: hypothetical protein ACRC6V_17035 [Bacteroidales bacterium]
MILIEMQLAGELDFATVMINMAHISEVSEYENDVQLTMASGNTYHITKTTFQAAIGSVEGINYLKFKAEGDEPVDEVTEVEGELVPAE